MNSRDFCIAALYDSNSWPNEIGAASCRCVRPTFWIFLNFFAFLFSSDSKVLIASRRAGSIKRIAKRVAVGIMSFDDCERFTWSFG